MDWVVVVGLIDDGANAAQDVIRERRAMVYFMVTVVVGVVWNDLNYYN